MNSNGFGPPNAFHCGQNMGQSHPPQNFPRPNHNSNFQNKMKRKNSNEFSHEHFKNGNSNSEQQGNKKKGKKKAKPPKEVDYSHYCDVCDRGFKSEDLLQTHISEHIQCTEKDCRFVGHPKVVKLHHKMQHGPGSKKIRWLDTPEDIQKWRNDRKRNFPTAATIAKKADNVEKKQQQGNVLETRQFGKMKRGQRNQRGRGRGRGHPQGRIQGQSQQTTSGNKVQDALANHNEAPPAKIRKTEEEGEEETGRRASQAQPQTHHRSTGSLVQSGPVQGKENGQPTSTTTQPEGQRSMVISAKHSIACDPLSLLAADENESDEEDSGLNVSHVPVIEVAPKGSFGALGSLAANYDTDSDDSNTGELDERPKEVYQNGSAELIDIKKISHTVRDEISQNGHQSLKSSPAKTLEVPDDVPGDVEGDVEVNICKNGESLEGKSGGWQEGHKRKHLTRKERRMRKKDAIARERAQKNAPKPRKATLLEMLLAPEMRKERNVILQCVRHVVKKNFFQSAASSTS